MQRQALANGSALPGGGTVLGIFGSDAYDLGDEVSGATLGGHAHDHGIAGFQGRKLEFVLASVRVTCRPLSVISLPAGRSDRATRTLLASCAR